MRSMTSKAPIGGLAFLCNRAGQVLGVLRDDLSLLGPGAGVCLYDRLDRMSVEKAANFLRAIDREAAVFGWELNFKREERFALVQLNGTNTDRGLLIVGAATTREAAKLAREFMAMSNEQTNALRAAFKDLAQAETRNAEGEQAMYEELSRLNNELVTLQRELARKNHELAKLNGLKDAFLGMASHDLRKPVSAIVMNTGMLTEAPGLNSDDRKLAESILEACRKMQRQLAGFIDIAQIESGKLRLNLRAVQLEPLVRARVEHHRRTAEGKGINISLRKASESPVLQLDPDRVEQAIDNLLENAVKYTPAGGAIEVAIGRTSTHAQVSVSDNGPGIDQDQAATLFALFQTAGSKPTGGETSTGLGLAIVKAIAIEHGGGVRLENRPGQGATLVLELPLDEAGLESGLRKTSEG